MQRFRVPHSLNGRLNGHIAQSRRLIADDGVFVHAEHASPAQTSCREIAFVVVHGFTQNGEKPGIRMTAQRLRQWGGVVTVDMRGHGRSTGESTLGRHEIHDVAAAAQWARALGYLRVVTIGFSMGGAVVLRHAALVGGVDAVASVSSPGQWFYRGTANMRVLHHLVLTRPGRMTLRAARGVRVSPKPWKRPYPIDPRAAAAEVSVPLLVVHGRVDHYFPAHHGWGIHAANANSDLWLERDFGHAEGSLTADLADRIADWLVRKGRN